MKAVDITIRAATPGDAAAVADICNPYVAGTTISFEERPVAPAEMAARIAEIGFKFGRWIDVGYWQLTLG